MPWEYYAKWSKSGREWQMPYDLTYVDSLNKKLIDTKDVCLCTKSFSHVQLSVIPWTVAHQAPLSMGFSRQEYWSGLPCPLPGYLHDPGIEPTFPISPALAGRSFTTSATWEAPIQRTGIKPGSSALQLDLSHLSYQGSPYRGEIGGFQRWKVEGGRNVCRWAEGTNFQL